jgi:hypothetical protein
MASIWDILQGNINTINPNQGGLNVTNTVTPSFSMGTPIEQAYSRWKQSNIPLARQLRGEQVSANDYAKDLNYQLEASLKDPMNFLGTTKVVGLLNPIERKVAEKGFDPRFDPRVKEQERLKNLTTIVEPTGSKNIPEVSLADFEGKPFITSMSDRTAAGGNLVNINGIPLNRPVNLGGGQDFMFYNPMVWSSGQSPTKQILNQAQTIKQITGQDPLYVPWRMAPTGGDFAHMTGESMLNYADAALGKSDKKQMDKAIKNFIPDWKGVSDSNAIEQYRNTPDKVRKQVKGLLDTEFRDKGGLSIGEARLSVADQKQLLSPDAGIMNIGKIFADEPMIMNSGHVSYPRGVPGEGIGRLNKEYSIFQLLPQVVEQRGIMNPLQPSQTDIRALQMKPYAGILTPDILKALGY